MEYISFGHGEKNLVMLPGLGEALRSLKGTAFATALLYREFARDYKVYIFSRISPLPDNYSTMDMANDVALAMDILSVSKADVIGVSMGGMIAQHLATLFPKKVNKLVIVASSSRLNSVLKGSLEEWLGCALRSDHKALMDSNLKRIYSDDYYRKNRWLIPILGVLTKPKSYNNFLIQAKACFAHDCFDILPQINCPVFVIGGEKDNTLSGAASREIAAQIPNSTLLMYPQWGHGLYDEAKDFKQQVLNFLLK